MSRTRLFLVALLLVSSTTLIVTGVVPQFCWPALVHAQNGSSQLYLNRAQRIATQFDATIGQGAPLSLAVEDFDGDGIHDLAIGISTPVGGMLAIRRGNLDAFAPQSDASLYAIARGEFPSPYLPIVQTVNLPGRPDLLAAGDFVGEDGPGLVAATRGGHSLYVVARSASGKLDVLQTLNLAGPITAIATHQLQPGRYTQVVVGVRGDKGPQMRIFTGSHDGLSETARFSLTDDATSFVFGNLDGDFLPDVLAVAGGQVFVLHSGTRTIERVLLPFQTASAALGSFVSDRDSILSMALLATDGSLHILANSQGDSRRFSLQELRALRLSRNRRGAAVMLPKQRGVEWKELETYPNVANMTAGKAPVMFRTRISSNALDDVMLLDSGRMSVLTHPDANMESGIIITRSDLGADAVAALPERVNIDGRPGVIFVTNSDPAPYAMMPLPDPTFTVNRFDDPVPPTPITSVCNGGASSCSLREAVLRANNALGTDTIIVPNGTYTLSLPRVAGDFTGQHGTLEVTDSVNIVGGGINTTIVQAGTTAANGVDKIFSFNQDIALFTTASVSISNMTLRFGNNNGEPVTIQDGWGGAFDFDTGGSNAATATATLTVTACNITNNQTNDGEGGGVTIWNTNQGTGNATFIASLIQNNTANRGATDANGAGNGGGMFVAWPAKVTMTNSQVLSNTATQHGTGSGVGGGIYALGGGNVADSVTIHGSTVSGNTAAGDGGGIWSTAGLTLDLGSVVSNNSSNGNGGGIWFNGDPGNPASLSKVTITGNNAKGTNTLSAGAGGGIYVGSAGQPLTISFSRLANNLAKATASKNLANQTSGGAGSAVTATNNWWGTNTPGNVVTPSTSSCPAAGFQVCTSPSLHLNMTSSASPLLVGAASTLTATFLQDSLGNPVTASNLNVMAGVPIAFNNAANGAISNAQAAIQNVASISSATESGTLVTITTTAPHTFTSGQTVTVAGVAEGYDGQFTLTTITSTTFTYTASASGLPTISGVGTATVPVGTATLTFTANHVGLGSVDATIDGFTLTLSPKIPVNDNTTTTAVNQTATYHDANQNVTLTANVTSGSGCCTVAGGTVTFTVKNGAATVGSPVTSGVVAGGTVSATYILPGGTNAAVYTIQAVYSGTSTGAGDFLTSSDVTGTHTLTVNAAPTATTVSNATAVFNASSQTVPLSATVTSVDGIVNAGTVTFTVFDGGNNQVGSPVTSAAVSVGSASVNFTLPAGSPIGIYSIHGTYNGSTNFLTSSDNTHNLTVNATTTTTASDAAATFSTTNQTVSLSAIVSSAGGTVNAGTVTFAVFNGATQIGSPVVSGTVAGGAATASYTLPGGTAAAVYSIHATYSGAGNFLSSSDTTHNLRVGQVSTTTTATNTTANFSASNQTVAFSATVTSPSGTVSSGTVTFTVFNGATQVGFPVTSGTVTSGNASANYTLPGGTASGVYSIHAAYSGTTNLATSNDNTHTLTVNAGTTTTAANASAPFSASNQPVTLSATVSSTGGTVGVGTVTFSVFNGATQIGSSVISGTVANGAASVSYTLPGGTAANIYSIHASYSGGGTFGASSDNTHSLTVNADSTTTAAAAASATFSTASQTVPLSATVTSSTAVNEGTVTFTIKNGAVTVGAPVTSATVTGGAAAANFTLPGGTPAGPYTIQAVYNPGPQFTTSNEASHILTVNKATPVITWSNPADITFGGALSAVQLNATADVAGSFVYTPPAGTVLPLGNGQTLSVAFTPTDTTDYNNASKNVLINVLPALSPATLILTQTSVRDPGTNEVVITVTLANTGGAAATNVQALTAKIGTTSTTTLLPAVMPDIPGAGSSSIVLRFPGSIGSAGTRVVLSFTASSSAGQFSGSSRVTLP